MRRFPLMVFAAGFGTRMGALSANRPKPMIQVAGRPLIDHALALADPTRFGPVVVNLHYLGDQLERHLTGRDLHLSWERNRILDTGGGLKQALPWLGDGPVMALNSDAVWTGPNPLDVLATAWRDEMEGLLLVAPAGQVLGRPGKPADFLVAPDGRLRRAKGALDGVIYLGAQILRRDAVAAWPETVFSLNRIWDAMIARGGLFAAPFPGRWCDVGTPEGLAEAEALVAGSRDG